MKKTIFVLPVCLFFAFCSSSKKATAPIGPGISNVNVKRNDTMTSAANASSSFTVANRDWAYKANRDTSLNGTWTLDGMVASNGNWSNTQSWYKDSSASMTDTTMTITTTDTAYSAGTTNRNKRKNKINRKALYDSAQARLRMDYKSTSTLDTTVQPYKYWTRIPTVTLNATRLVFSGTTGCNSMSGSFNFNDKDIQFGQKIATSKMMCNEYDETAFLSALKKADNYTLNGNTLQLKQGSTLLLSFKRS